MEQLIALLPLLQAVALVVIPILGTVLVWAVKTYLKDAQARTLVVKAAQGAAGILDVIAARTENEVDDAVAKMLKDVALELGRGLTTKETHIVRGVAVKARSLSLDTPAERRKTNAVD